MRAHETILSGLILMLAGTTLLAGCGDDDGGGNGGNGDVTVSEAHFPQSVASGDPTPDGVVLWTRLEDASLTADAALTLVVAEDEALTQGVTTLDVTAPADNDFVVKRRVDGLQPGQHYWYRFEYDTGDGVVASRTGRTKTAPENGSDVPVRFAYLNCQDFSNRYYNAHAHLLKRLEQEGEQDLDFVVFLGDYIYETSDVGSGDREVNFEDEAGAIPLGATYAASSLSNYRQLYKTYRSDPMLQELHERYPVFAIWDDHEFSDDSWDATATYFNGRVDETNEARRRHSEQVFFEYMPIDVGLSTDGTLDIGPDILYPNTRIYGSHRWGANVELMLTDYRTFRPDHFIPEDAFPGTIVLDADALGDAGVEPYVDLSDAAQADLRSGLLTIVAGLYLLENDTLEAAEAQALADAALTGFVSARYINALLQGAGQPAAFDDAALAALPKGLAWLTMGKQTLYSQVGARYAVLQDTYYAYAQALAAERGGPANVYGDDQSQWLSDALSGTDATWKVVGSSVSFAPLVLDFANPTIAGFLPAGFPFAGLRLQLNADHWDGFPLAKEYWLGEMSKVPNVVLISGDIHSSFVTDHGDRGDYRVFEFTGPSASSETFGSFVAETAAGLGLEGVDPLVQLLPTLLQTSSTSAEVNQPSQLSYANTTQHGYVLMDADATALTASYALTTDVEAPLYDLDFTALDAGFDTRAWRVQDGSLSRQ